MKYLIIDIFHKDWEYQSDDLEEIMQLFNKLNPKYYVLVEVLGGDL